MSTATAEKRPASLKPTSGKVARARTGILKRRTRGQRAQCRLRWYLRLPVPLLIPLQREYPRKLWLGEAPEPTVRPSILRERCLTSSRPYPSSHPTRIIIFSRHLPLNGLNFHGIAAFLMSLNACCSLTGRGADALGSLEPRVAPGGSGREDPALGCALSPMTAALHPCCILTGMGPLKSPLRTKFLDARCAS